MLNDQVDAWAAELAPETFSTTNALDLAPQQTHQLEPEPEPEPEDEATLSLPATICLHALESKGGLTPITLDRLPTRTLIAHSSWARSEVLRLQHAADPVAVLQVSLPATVGARDLHFVAEWLQRAHHGATSARPCTASVPGGEYASAERWDAEVPETAVGSFMTGLRAAHFFRMSALQAALQQRLISDMQDTNYIDLLVLSNELGAARLRAACVRRAMVCLLEDDASLLQDDAVVPASVRAQLRAITSLRTAALAMGLGALGFDDAGEFVAMLKGSLREQRERLVQAELQSGEAIKYERSQLSTTLCHNAPPRPSGIRVRRYTTTTAGASVRVVLPLDAARARLEYAKLLHPRLGAHAVRWLRDVDVAIAVGSAVRPTLPLFTRGFGVSYRFS